MAETTASKRRAIRQEELREKLKGLEYIRKLDMLAKDYDQVRKEIDKAAKAKLRLNKDDRKRLTEINQQLNVLKFKVDVIQKQIDLEIRRLKFVLPELKAMELSDPKGENPLSPLVEVLSKALESK